jgi:hypothetical protein
MRASYVTKYNRQYLQCENRGKCKVFLKDRGRKNSGLGSWYRERMGEREGERERENKPQFVVFANFCDINGRTMADSNSQSITAYLTISNHLFLASVSWLKHHWKNFNL